MKTYSERVIVKVEEDKASFKEWTFWFYSGVLWLDEYSENIKPAGAKKFKQVKIYSRLFGRNSNMKESEVLIPEEVKKEALGKFINQITEVSTWSKS